MRVIGLTGPTGAGKTTALRALGSLGAEVVDADGVYHALLKESGELRADLVRAFGEGILDGAGGIDRRKLAQAVYPHRLEELNAITHPRVAERVDALIAAAEEGGRAALAIDAVALVESGLARRCDTVVAVLAPREVRVRRVMARDGVDEAYARRRVEAQRPDSFYREHSDHVLENSGEDGPGDFERRALELFRKILG